MPDAPLHTFLTGPLPGDVHHVLRRLQETEGVTRIAVMPDVHLASEFCIGTVVASESRLFPNAVGGDIGCGMLALRFDAPNGAAETLADPDKAARILGALAERCPARRHHRRTAPPLPEELHDLPFSHAHLRAQSLSDDTRTQLGTLGGGNHFLELQADEHDHLWLMLHTGSRHLGQIIHHHHLAKTQKLDTKILAFDAASPAGRDYFADVQLARRWASHNRAALAPAAAVLHDILDVAPDWPTLINIDHNHASLETHASRELFIHRKGATPADVDQPGLIPGSMGTVSFHTRGRGHADALRSSSHGAGRLLSRAQARQQITRTHLRQQLRDLWYDPRLENALREEAPTAYKPIHEVMRAQSALTAITRKLRPLLVYKGSS